MENIIDTRFLTARDDMENKSEIVITNSLQRRILGLRCNECNAIYKSKSGLYSHIKTAHEGVKYDCNQCDYRATHQSNLTKHIRLVHKKSVH